MGSVMRKGPFVPTNITKLKSTAASDMVASLILLYNKLAFFALPIAQIFLKKFDFLIITLSLMYTQKTL